MASVAYTIAKKDFLDATVNMASDVIKAMLLMTNTTADTEAGAATVSAITTLDEFDGAGYIKDHGGAGRQVIDITVATSGTEGQATADVDPETWTALSVGTRDIQGALVHKEGTADDTTAVPIAFVDFPSDITPNGGDISINWAADGVIKIT